MGLFEEIWHGRVRLLYKIRVHMDEQYAPSQLPSQHADNYFPELDLAMIECFEQFKRPGLPSIALSGRAAIHSIRRSPPTENLKRRSPPRCAWAYQRGAVWRHQTIPY